MAKKSKKVKPVDTKAIKVTHKPQEFYSDIQEKLVKAIQWSLDNEIPFNLGVYGKGVDAAPAQPATEGKTIVKEVITGEPTNFTSDRRYTRSNCNKFTLAIALNGFKTGWFGTYKQWNDAGCSILPGQKGTKGRHWVTYDLTIEQMMENMKSIAVGLGPIHIAPDDQAVYFYVYNLDQVKAFNPAGEALLAKLKETKKVGKYLKEVYIPGTEAVPAKEATDAFGNSWFNIPQLDKFKMGSLEIVCNSRTFLGIAYFEPSENKIHMPSMTTGFRSSAFYYKVMLHEIAHATGLLLGRSYGNFGDAQFCKEELIAEMTAHILATEFDICVVDDEKTTSPDYLARWLKELKEGSEYLKSVMGEVNKACELIRKAISSDNPTYQQPLMDESHS